MISISKRLLTDYLKQTIDYDTKERDRTSDKAEKDYLNGWIDACENILNAAETGTFNG